MTQKPVVMGPPKITRSSKKNKKSWRVNIDVTEVEEGLEEERFDERIGGGHEKKKDEDLFMLDSAGTENEEKDRISQKKEEEKKAPVYSESLNKMKAKKFKCFALIDGLPGADPLSKRKAGPMPKNKVAVKRLEEKDKRMVSQIDKIRRDRQRTMDEKKKKIENIDEDLLRTKFAHDLWDDEDPDAKKNTIDELLLNDQWVKHDTRIHVNIGNSNNHRPKVTMKKNKTLVPAVELPHSGQSYNPTVEDHQEILWKAAMIEIEKEKKTKKLERVLTGMFPTADKTPTYKDYLEEMAQGIPELGGKVEESDDDDAEEEGEGYTKEGAKLKTKKKRRNERLRKREEYLRKKAKGEKIEMNKIVSLRTYKKEMNATVSAVQEKRKRRDAREVEKLKGPTTLSKYKYKPQNIEIKLSDEISGNLRNLKPEGSLLEDRFKSLQRRRMLETREFQVASKRKVKVVLNRKRLMGFEEELRLHKDRVKQKKRNKTKKKAKSLEMSSTRITSLI